MRLGSLLGEKYLPEIPGIVCHIFCSDGVSRGPGVLPDIHQWMQGEGGGIDFLPSFPFLVSEILFL